MADDRLYGIHAVLAALQAERRRIAKVCVSTQRRGAELQRIVALAERRGIPVVSVAPAQLQQFVGQSTHQGVVAFVEPRGYQPWTEVIAQVTALPGPQTLLALDGVTDVGNFAALIRSAAAFGVHAIIVPRHAAVTLTSTVAKRSAGAIERVAIVRVVNLVRSLDELKQHGFWVYGADMRADLRVARVTWPERLVLVLGSEGSGMRRLVRECCDGCIRIPMCAGADALNVAIAGAIILAYRWDACAARLAAAAQRGEE